MDPCASADRPLLSFFPIAPTMCMTSDPYAAGYTFARSAFTGGPTRDQKAVRTIYIYIYIYIYTTAKSLF